ncbi:hypothetical protein NMG60_11024854 [Bertholletia excelsa]
MGLSSFPSPAEGFLPVLVMNAFLSVALLKNMVRYVLQLLVRGRIRDSSNLEDELGIEEYTEAPGSGRARRVSITRFKSLCRDRDCACVCCNGSSSVECCVCLCGFEADEEVSELSCKHFFHRGCLDRWFDNQQRTCPLCRSML